MIMGTTYMTVPCSWCMGHVPGKVKRALIRLGNSLVPEQVCGSEFYSPESYPAWRRLEWVRNSFHLGRER